MESVGTKSYRQRSSDSVGFEAPAPHIVVVCPSCKTSFAVETATVAALETPRFHCSRCDDIFIMKDAPVDMLPLGGVQVQSIAQQSGLHHRNVQQRGRSHLPESSIKASDFSLGSSSSAPKSFIEPNFDAPPEPPLTSRSEFSLLSQSLEDPSIEEPPVMRESAVEPAATWKDSVRVESAAVPTVMPAVMPAVTPTVAQPVRSHDFVVAPTETRTQPISSRQFVLSDPPPTLPDHAMARTQAKEQTTAVAVRLKGETPASAQPPRTTERYQPVPQPRRGEQRTSSSSEPRRFSARTQSLISMSAPLLGSLAALLGISYCAQMSPQSVDALFNYVTPKVFTESVQTTPPSALGVKNLRLSFQKTRNREFVPVITGTVINDSGRAFQSVELEVIGFNERGEIIASSRAPLRSSLGSEKIAKLSLDMVARYQNTLAAKDNSIKAREALPFTAALINARQVDDSSSSDFDPSKVKYFSARIFSIKRP
jgi:predicted Zn finger-like uncharacterized protein